MLRVSHIRLVIILAIMMVIVTQLTTCVKQSVTLAVNISMILLIHLLATDHPVIAVESSIQDERMVNIAMNESVRNVVRKEERIFIQLLTSRIDIILAKVKMTYSDSSNKSPRKTAHEYHRDLS